MLRAFRQAGCREIVIIGAVRRPALSQIRPDFGFLRALPAVFALTKGGDDSVLSKVVRFFEGQGFVVRGAHEFSPGLLAKTGVLGAIKPSGQHLQAIGRGRALLAAIGEFDIGQAVIAGPDRIAALEGSRGTDAMIASVGRQQGNGRNRDLLLVKLPKPGQELRVDMPTIGPATIDHIQQSGLGGIAVSGGQTLILERDKVIDMADAAGLFVMGIEDCAPDNEAQDNEAEYGRRAKSCEAEQDLAVLGTRKPRAQDWRDISKGQRLLAVLKAHAAGNMAVVSHDYVLAVGNGESPVQMLRALGKGQPYGRLLPRRRGVLLFSQACHGAYPAITDEVLKWARKLCLAGVVFADGVGAHDKAVEAGCAAQQEPSRSPQNLSGSSLLAVAKAKGLFVVGPHRPSAQAPGEGR